MIKVHIFIITIFLFGFSTDIKPAYYQPQTKREVMFLGKAEEWFTKAKRLEKEVNDVKEKLNSKKEELKQAHVIIEQKDKALAEAVQQINSLEDQLKVVLTKSISSTEENTALLLKLNEAEQEVDRFKKNITRLEQQIEELTVSEKRLSKDKKRLSLQIETQIASIASVSAQQHQQALAAVVQLRKEISPLRRAVSPLRRQVAAKDAEIARLQLVLSEMRLKTS